MASPGQVPKELEEVTSDNPVSDHSNVSEHEDFNNPTQSGQSPSTNDPPTTAEAVLRILTAVEKMSFKMDEHSDDSSSDEGSRLDDEPVVGPSEIVEDVVASQDDSFCPDIERLPMWFWNPPLFLQKRFDNKRQSIVTAFYTDVPINTTIAKDPVSDSDFIAAYSKDKWSSAPQRILIHSREVMDELRLITGVPDAQKTGVLAMVPPFKYLIHHRTAIKAKLDELREVASDHERLSTINEDNITDEDRRIHLLQCIHDFIQTDLANYIGLELKCEDGSIEELLFQEIYHLFKPGQLVIGFDDGFDQVYRVTSVIGGRRLLSSPSDRPADGQAPMRAGTWTDVEVGCTCMVWDGENIGCRQSGYTISYFTGTRPVTDLSCFPIHFHKDANGLRKRLCARGWKQVHCVGHKRYTGESVSPHCEVIPFLEKKGQATIRTAIGDEDSEDEDGKKPSPIEMVQGDVYIDYRSIFGSFFSTHPKLCNQSSTDVGVDAEAVDTLSDGRTWNCSDRDVDGIRSWRFLRMNRHLTKSFGRPKSDMADDEERLQLLTSQVPAFVFSTRKWKWLNIDNVEDIDKSEGSRNSGWNELVIPHKFSQLLLSLVSNHISDVRIRQWEALARHDSSVQIDLVRGKGQGLIILLHGPPGSGKTSTAETIAAYTGRPLYAITCGDLGSSPKELEKNIVRHTRLAQKWGCVLLLDEADVFLGSRTYDDMHRNAMVSIFLRQLEYYSGILFLTTNIVGVIDEAFKSRIHVALEYPAIDEESTLEIWKNILQRINQDNTKSEVKIRFDEGALLQFAKRHYRNHRLNGTTWNGRQIRNAFQTAIGIGQFERIKKIGEAETKGEKADKSTRYIKLSVASFATVAETTSDFERYITKIRGDDRERMAANQFRHDERSREPPLRKSYSTPTGSYRTEPDVGASRSGRSKIAERRYHGVSISPVPKRKEKGKETRRTPARASSIVSDSDERAGQDEVYRSDDDEGSNEEIIEEDIGDDEGDEVEAK